MHCRSEKATRRTNIGIGEMHDNTIGDHIGATHRLYATGNLWARIRFIFAFHDFKCKLQKQHTFRQLCNSFVVLINLVSAKQDELHTKLNGDFALKMLCYCCFICLHFLIRLGFFSLGICTLVLILRIQLCLWWFRAQDLALVNELSIKETIFYFGRIYGMHDERIRGRFKILTDLLELPDSDRLVENLSGGQKRRVSFACALVHGKLRKYTRFMLNHSQTFPADLVGSICFTRSDS